MYRNIMEILVEEKVADLLRNTDFCKCKKCMEDVISMSLNNLEPHYVSSDIGSLYAKAQLMSKDIELEIVKQIAMSMKIVSENPHHNNQ